MIKKVLTEDKVSKLDPDTIRFCYDMFDLFADIVGQLETYGVRRIDGKKKEWDEKPDTSRQARA